MNTYGFLPVSACRDLQETNLTSQGTPRKLADERRTHQGTRRETRIAADRKREHLIYLIFS